MASEYGRAAVVGPIAELGAVADAGSIGEAGAGAKGAWAGMGAKGAWAGAGAKGAWADAGARGAWAGIGAKGAWAGAGTDSISDAGLNSGHAADARLNSSQAADAGLDSGRVADAGLGSGSDPGGAEKSGGAERAADSAKPPKKRISLVWRIATSQILSNISVITSLNVFIAAVVGGYLFFALCGAAGAAARADGMLSGPSPLYGSYERESVPAPAPGAGLPFPGVGFAVPAQLAPALNIPDGTIIGFSAVRTGAPSFLREWFTFSSYFAFEAEMEANGVADGTAGGAANGTVGGTADGVDGGMTNGVADGTSGGVANGVADGTVGGAANEAANGVADGTAGSTTDGAANVAAGSQRALTVIAFSQDGLLFDIWRVLCALLAFELFIVIGKLAKARRTTKALLHPITELTFAAQNINTDPDPSLKLLGAINTLNTITEQHLDRRISIEDERVELKGLASAINAMLDRLDAAYGAQLRFVSDASHELRTPISVIQGYANLLDRWGKNDEKAMQESIDAIKNEAEGMKALVEQLLFLARSDYHSIALSMECIDVSEIVEDVRKETLMIDEAHEHRADISPGLAIYGDAQFIKQAVRIFVDNSIKYTPSGGTVTIKAAKPQDRPGCVAISVGDTGIGIPGESLPLIFDRFFRTDESRARKSGGTGLGLSIAKWIIESHDGSVEVVSRKDVGTKFTMYFPSL